MSSEFSPDRSSREPSPVLFGVIVAVGVTMLFQMGARTAGLLVPSGASGPLLLALPLGIAQLAMMLLPTLHLHHAQSLTPSELLRLRPVPVAAHVAAAVGTFAIWQILQSYLIAQELLMPHDMIELYRELEGASDAFFRSVFGSGNILELAAAMIVGGAIPAVSEELLFRGASQRSFERRLRPAWAILLSALLFATLHLNPITWVPLLALGLFFGYVAWRSRSIYPTILSHFLFNAVSIIGLYHLGEGTPAGEAHTIDDLRASLIPSGVALILLAIVIRWFAAMRPERGAGVEGDGTAGS